MLPQKKLFFFLFLELPSAEEREKKSLSAQAGAKVPSIFQNFKDKFMYDYHLRQVTV